MADYVSSLLFVMLLVFPVYTLARIFWVKTKGDNRTLSRELTMGLFVLFMFGLLVLTFQDSGFPWMKADSFEKAINRIRYRVGVNFVPFKTIRNYIRYSPSVASIIINIGGNILLFIPWGLCLPMFWKKFYSAWRLIAASLLLPVTIEFCQLFIGRSVDIDDVILNFTGSMIGVLLFAVLRRIFPKLNTLAG